MKIGSLFSGIGGLELGLERAGVGRTIWQCEADAYARLVLSRHWPGVQQFTDVQTMGIKESIPDVDVICGGFPCQDLSTAGKRAGLFGGTRSGLYFELLRVVRAVGPRYVVLENVSALLAADRGLAMGAVLGTLAESGYDARWDCLPASSVGAPHRRDRVFILAYSTEARRSEAIDQVTGSEPLGHGKTRRALSDALRVDGNQDAPILGGSLEGEASSRANDEARQPGTHWRIEPSVGRVADGIPDRLDRLARLGNAVVPQVAQIVGEWILEHEEVNGYPRRR